MLNNSATLDRLFAALADPTRRDLVERLIRGPASVSELAAPFAMSLPAVLQHLQVLETSGLVATEKVGRVRTCRIEPMAVREAEAWLNQQRLAWERRLDALGELLTSPHHAQPTDSQGDEQSAGRNVGPQSPSNLNKGAMT